MPLEEETSNYLILIMSICISVFYFLTVVYETILHIQESQ